MQIVTIQIIQDIHMHTWLHFWLGFELLLHLFQVIGRAGTGVDNIDVPAATKHGIIVMKWEIVSLFWFGC